MSARFAATVPLESADALVIAAPDLADAPVDRAPHRHAPAGSLETQQSSEAIAQAGVHLEQLEQPHAAVVAQPVAGPAPGGFGAEERRNGG